MDDAALQFEIQKLLRKSGIPIDQKDLIRFSLPFMLKKDLMEMHKILLDEKNKVADSREESGRIEMKYEVIINKLADIEIEKAKKRKS